MSFFHRSDHGGYKKFKIYTREVFLMFFFRKKFKKCRGESIDFLKKNSKKKNFITYSVLKHFKTFKISLRVKNYVLNLFMIYVILHLNFFPSYLKKNSERTDKS